ncbi:MAG: glycosyltransferase family 2 protein [Halobacteriota archaeon]
MSYVLITPIKNEAENLPQLKAIVLDQTMLPVVWIIIDGNSTDESFSLAEDLFADYPWVKVVRQQFFCGRGYQNMSAAINEGYNYAKKHCADNHTSYAYVGKIDATSILQPDYFAILFEEMERDPQLAFTCGVDCLLYRGKLKEITPRGNFSNTGYSDVRLYQKRFFEEIGGYPLTPFPDGCLQLKAANRSWKYAIVERTRCEEPRVSGAKNGVWSGYIAKGRDMYVLGYHLLLMLLSATNISITFPPHYQVVPIAIGYLSSAIRREKRVEDDEIRNYYGRQRLRELWHDLNTSKP